MPALDYTSTTSLLFRSSLEQQTANSSASGLDVICAFPLSGQYGPGARILYYVLVVACVFARKIEWVRNACLAAALLFPVVAAVHGVVLAAEHIPNAVDMDVFGAFQLCALGVLAAPVTVRRSTTYFNNKGRNIIFVWCLMVLAGLISLTVEFYRISPVHCTHTDSGQPLSSNPRLFPYQTTFCGLTCDTNNGPFSPLRGGSANNIYVIPAPTVLTFNAATLLAAACCVPGLLLLAAMWIKILEIKWRARVIERTSFGEVRKGIFTHIVRQYAEVALFGAAVAAIVVVGEMNFFSVQVDYETEPMANVGQWAPIVGTGLAVFASLYILLADALAEERENRDEGNDEVQNPGWIRKLARILLNISEWMGTPSPDRFGDLDFRRGSVLEYPTVPGEDFRNRDLSRTRSNYEPRRESKDSGVSHISHISRVRSSTVDSVTPPARVATSMTMNSDFTRFTFDDQTSTTRVEADRRTSSPAKRTSPKRRDTLEVPSPPRRTLTSSISIEMDSSDTVAGASTPETPVIVVSPHADQT